MLSVHFSDNTCFKVTAEAVGSLRVTDGILQGLISMPLDVLPPVLQALSDGALKYVVMDGPKLRYRVTRSYASGPGSCQSGRMRGRFTPFGREACRTDSRRSHVASFAGGKPRPWVEACEQFLTVQPRHMGYKHDGDTITIVPTDVLRTA